MDDRYQIIKRTDEFPYGIQYEATDTLINRTAEIHRFSKPGEDVAEGWEDRYDELSRDLTTLSHMGLPIIYDKGVDEAGPYLIRQYVDETTLAARLAEGPLNEYEVWEFAHQLLDIHFAGLAKEFYHGALSPDQICFATRPGGEKRYYISNFGLADLHNRLNETSEYFGAPCLVSLEQLDGQPPSEASEIFSIGQLLYMCLADNHPFAANRVDEMAELQRNYPLAPISELRGDIPAAMSDWIGRLTALDPEERFSTYAEAIESLPAPVQTAPVPVIPTHTTTQQVQSPMVGQGTAAQQTVSSLTGTQAVGFATTTQAQTVAATPAKAGGVKALLQEPMILGGAALLIVLMVVGGVMLSGGEDGEKAKTEQAQGDDGDDNTDSGEASAAGKSSSGLNDGLVVALNFDGKLFSANDQEIKAERLGSAAKYGKGVHGRGLVLDQKRYYRLELGDVLKSAESGAFTIAFWVKNLSAQQASLVSDEPWSGDRNRKINNGGQDKWQWTPKQDLGAGEGSVGSGWSLMTLVFSQKDDLVLVYNDGSLVGSTSSDSVGSLSAEEYLYIGCDRDQKMSFAAPALIDQLYIWNRKLSSKEVRSLYKDEFVY